MKISQAMPASLTDRADILDVLRGFALLGVMIDNLFGFTGWGFFTQPMREALPTWPADGILAMLELAFVHGKFYSLFSLLFGIGFSIILIRNEKKGINPFKIFYRRLFVLLLFGIFHLFFLWDGDILLLYALIGLFLPLFRKCSNRTLLIWAVLLLLSPILIDLVKITINLKTGDFLEAMAISIDSKNGIEGEAWRQFLFKEESGWKEWREWLDSGFLFRYAYIIESNRIPKVLGMFLLGFWAGRKMIYAKLEDNISLFKKMRKWGLIIGIPASLAMAYFEIDEKTIPNPWGLLDSLSYALGVAPLSLAYASVICLYWIKRKGETKWKLLAPVGRMALTNYLMQTIIGVTLYYGVGLGLGGNIGPSIFFPAALGVYAIQIAYSNLWFRSFNYGPLEWIWRQLTYWKRLPLRKN